MEYNFTNWAKLFAQVLILDKKIGQVCNKYEKHGQIY